MSKKPSRRKRKARSYKRASVFCNICGTLILLAIIGISLPLTLPRYMGYEIFDVVSGSMAPTIPMDSIVYVKPADVPNIQPGEVIAFYDSSGTSIVVHRVVENLRVDGEFITKGDANASPDPSKVSYKSVYGTVVFHAPVYGRLSVLYTSSLGKVYALAFAVVAAMFYILAGQLKSLSIATLEKKKKTEVPEELPPVTET